MDSEQFDHLTARLAAHLTRRRSLGLLAAFGATAAGFATGADARRKKKHKKKKQSFQCPATCPVCQACVDGRSCTLQADGTACQGTGKCLQGVCNPKPTCASFGANCGGTGSASCCSGFCLNLGPDFQFCESGGAGATCNVDPDCDSGRCVGYRCT